VPLGVNDWVLRDLGRWKCLLHVFPALSPSELFVKSYNLDRPGSSEHMKVSFRRTVSFQVTGQWEIASCDLHCKCDAKRQLPVRTLTLRFLHSLHPVRVFLWGSILGQALSRILVVRQTNPSLCNSYEVHYVKNLEPISGGLRPRLSDQSGEYNVQLLLLERFE
jgi:hypothetical protein